jgi:hypothetical protein
LDVTRRQLTTAGALYDQSMNPLVTLVLVALTTHRLTRLITRDVFPPVRATREWIERKLGDDHWLTYLTQCDWCASVYVAASVTTGLALLVSRVLHDSWFPWPVWILVGAGASTLTGLVAQREP